MRRRCVLFLSCGVLAAGGAAGPRAVEHQAGPLEVVDATIDDVRAAIQSRRVTCRDLVRAY